MDEENTKTTSDIYLAAAFMSLGARLHDVNRDDPRHQRFTFESDELDFSDVESQWINQSLMVNGAHYKVALQNMKSVIYA